MGYSSKDEQQFINCTLSGPVRVYVRDGKIQRILPLEYMPDDAPPWSIEARGQTFTRPNKAGIAAWIQGSKQYVYSKDRLLTPVKRVDFDPDGNRNPQNRGVSGYEPISWDEALDIISKEVLRIRAEYGPSAIAVTGSSHDSWGLINYRMSAMERFWNILGCTWVDHNPESWEGFFWGAIHAWGFYWRLGQPPAYDLLEDTFKHTDMIVFWSSDPTTTSGDYAWNETDLWRFHMKKLGIKFVFIDPFNNYTAVSPSPSPMSGSKRIATTRNTSTPAPSVSTSGRLMSWAKKTVSPRPPSGRRKNRVSLPVKSWPLRGNGVQNLPPWRPGAARA
jgi:trimethylamine-N-oxide reductase (cytochrome c)